MSTNEQPKDKLFDKDRLLIAIYCDDTSFELEFFQVAFEDGKIITPHLIRKTGDRGMGEGVYYFFEPAVEIPAGKPYEAPFRVADSCMGKEYNFQLFQQEIKTESDEAPIMDN